MTGGCIENVFDPVTQNRLSHRSDHSDIECSVTLLQAINEVRKRFKRDLPELDPETDMSITDGDYRKAQRKSETLEGLLAKHPLASSPNLQERLTLLRHKQVHCHTLLWHV